MKISPESGALRGESLAMHEAQPILIPFSSNASGINLHLILKLPFNMIMSRKRTRKVDWKYFFLNVVSVEGESGYTCCPKQLTQYWNCRWKNWIVNQIKLSAREQERLQLCSRASHMVHSCVLCCGGYSERKNRKYSWLRRESNVLCESKPHNICTRESFFFLSERILDESCAPTSNINLSLYDESAPFSISAVGSWNAERNQLFSRNPFSNSISFKLNYFRLENLFKRHNFSGVIFFGGRQKVFYESQPEMQILISYSCSSWWKERRREGNLFENFKSFFMAIKLLLVRLESLHS